MSKSFQVAVEEADRDPSADEEPYEFTFADDPDRKLYVYLPTEGQMMSLMALGTLVDEGSVGIAETAQAQTLLLNMFDKPSRAYVARRLMSRENALTLKSLFRVFQMVMEAEAARPTESSSASTQSRSASGSSSTAKPRRAASTRSTSPSTGSATTSTPGGSTTRPKAARRSTSS